MDQVDSQVVLDAEEQRILGCLLEKQVTVPASYPLTANSLKSACNQLNSRDPVVTYDDRTILEIVARLRKRELVRVIWSDTGRRTLKYHQLLEETLDLAEPERALLTVLLLRGPQSAGELKTRTERLHPFADKDSVEGELRRMAERELPLVQELARRHGEKDTRWIHLLGPLEAVWAEAAPAAPDREALLADGTATRDRRVLASYEAAAADYAEHHSAINDKPFELWLFARIAGLSDGPLVDVGCGPGFTTAALAEVGADASGVDISPAMVAAAAARFPELTFSVADQRRLLRPPAASGWGAVVSWYSLNHLAASELPAAIAALANPLDHGGWLALAVHAGSRTWVIDELAGHPVELPLTEHDPDAVRRAAAAAGLTDLEWYLRGPLPGTQENSEQFYLLARRP